MRTIKPFYRLSLFFAVLFISGCSKEETASPRLTEVKEDGVTVPASVSAVTLIHHSNEDGPPYFLYLNFQVTHSNRTAQFILVQEGPSTKLIPGVFPVYDHLQTVARYHYVYLTDTASRISDSRVEVTDVSEQDSRVSLNFSYKLYRNGDTTNVTGKLLNFRYDTYER